MELWLEMNRKWLGAGLGLLAAGALLSRMRRQPVSPDFAEEKAA
jgi:hypothetical protein